MLHLRLALPLAVAQDLVDAHLLVPARHRQEVLEIGRVGVEGKIGNAILGRAAELDVLLEVAERRRGRRGLGPEEARHLVVVDGDVRCRLARTSSYCKPYNSVMIRDSVGICSK